VGLSAIALILCQSPLIAQQPAGAPQGGQETPQGEQGARQGGFSGFGGRAAPTIDFNDHTGFTQIFDGKTLNGWDGATDIWSAQDGAIVGLSCPDKPAGTTFIIYKGTEVSDFELKVEMKLERGNSGIQYRSRQVEPAAFGARGGAAGAGRGGAQAGQGTRQGAEGTRQGAEGARQGAQGARQGAQGTRQGGPGAASSEPFAPCADHPAAPGQAAASPGGGAYTKWNVQGYQFDIAGNGTGNLWEGGRFEGERGTISTAGQVILMSEGESNKLLATMGSSSEVSSAWKEGEWNEIHLIARGYTFIHIVNGRVMTVNIDDDESKRQSKGIIAFQVEGTNMRASFRNVWLKTL